MHKLAASTVRCVLLLVLAAALLGAPSAASAAVVAELRVEGADRTLAPGHRYVTGSARMRTANVPPSCNGSRATTALRGPTALGLLDYGDAFHRALRPVRVSDEFDFGLFVCGIGDFLGSDTAFWLYKVNHRSPEVGADQFSVSRGDDVLWYFQDTERGINTGAELELRAPARAAPNGMITVRVLAYDSVGVARPAVGALVRGGTSPATAVTGPDGRAQLRVGDRARYFLKARRGGDVPSERRAVCVADPVTACPARRGERIYGTRRGDRIAGTRGSDAILAGRGDDRIFVRRGGRDRVRCGRGRDRVRASRNDFLRRDCEIVNGRLRAR